MTTTTIALSPSGHRRIGRGITTLLVGAFLVGVAVLAMAGSVFAPHSPSATDLALGLHGPTAGYPLGTDSLGRGVLSRVLAGARSAVIGPAVIAICALLLSNVVGVVAGYFGGRIDALILRVVDVLMALPAFLVVVVVLGVLGGGYWIAVGLLVLLAVPYDVRVVRGITLEQQSRPYVEVSRTLGLGNLRIMSTQIWPNLLPIVIANAFLDFAFSLVNLAGLAFLGLGSAPGSTDWGRMLADNESNLLGNVWAPLAPALMIVIVAVGMNLVGDWFSDRLAARGLGS